jgi:hypothetical protein
MLATRLGAARRTIGTVTSHSAARRVAILRSAKMNSSLEGQPDAPSSERAVEVRLESSVTPPVNGVMRRPLKTAVVLLLALAMLLAGGLAVVAAAVMFLSNPSGSYACTWLGQRALAGQEGFVRAHLGDASDFEVATYDCEDGSAAFLGFTTGLEPAAARAAFSSDPNCRIEPDQISGPGVVCGTGPKAVYLYFNTSSENTTTGELSIED